MDFTVDTLADGRGFLTLNIVDDYTRECVAIDVDRSPPGLRVARVLERLAATVGRRATIVVDNGPECAGRVLDTWTCQHVRMAEAQIVIEAWRVDCNTVRPHSALGNLTPEACARLSAGLDGLRRP